MVARGGSNLFNMPTKQKVKLPDVVVEVNGGIAEFMVEPKNLLCIVVDMDCLRAEPAETWLEMGPRARRYIELNHPDIYRERMEEEGQEIVKQLKQRKAK